MQVLAPGLPTRHRRCIRRILQPLFVDSPSLAPVPHWVHLSCAAHSGCAAHALRGDRAASVAASLHPDPSMCIVASVMPANASEVSVRRQGHNACDCACRMGVPSSEGRGLACAWRLSVLGRLWKGSAHLQHCCTQVVSVLAPPCQSATRARSTRVGKMATPSRKKSLCRT